MFSGWSLEGAAVREPQCTQNGGAGPCCRWQRHIPQRASALQPASSGLRGVEVPTIASPGSVAPRTAGQQNIPAKESLSGNRRRTARIRCEKGDSSPSPSPFSHIASLHHPSAPGCSVTRTGELFSLGYLWKVRLPVAHHHAFNRLHLDRSRICSGAGAAIWIDPTVCAEVSDESTGIVRSAMEPQWKGSGTDSAETLRKEPSVFKVTGRSKEIWARERYCEIYISTGSHIVFNKS